MKAYLEDMLEQSLIELSTRARTKKSTLSEVQRMYGFCLGVRASIMRLNKDLSVYEYEFKNSDKMQRLMQAEFGYMNKNETLNFSVMG